jgi:hypothetical protein
VKAGGHDCSLVVGFKSGVRDDRLSDTPSGFGVLELKHPAPFCPFINLLPHDPGNKRFTQPHLQHTAKGFVHGHQKFGRATIPARNAPNTMPRLKFPNFQNRIGML